MQRIFFRIFLRKRSDDRIFRDAEHESAKAARWVVDYYPADVIEDTDDATTIRLSTSDPMVAARLLLRLGGEAELIDGSEVGEALGELRERLR